MPISLILAAACAAPRAFDRNRAQTAAARKLADRAARAKSRAKLRDGAPS